MLLRKLSRMQKELYGGHKEFEEVDMKLEKLVEVDVYKAVDKAVNKVFTLWEKGMSLEEVKRELGKTKRVCNESAY